MGPGRGLFTLWLSFSSACSVNVALFLRESLPLVHAKSHLGVSFVCQYKLSISYLNPLSVLTG